jgi:hypothetical protein
MINTKACCFDHSFDVQSAFKELCALLKLYATDLDVFFDGSKSLNLPPFEDLTVVKRGTRTAIELVTGVPHIELQFYPDGRIFLHSFGWLKDDSLELTDEEWAGQIGCDLELEAFIKED